MATLRAWLAEFTKATNEQVDEIVLGWGAEWGDYHKDDWPEWDGWAATYPLASIPDVLLDHEFSDGFGGNESPNLCAWSESWVVFSDNYDGAESICWVPRNPTAHEPARPGGG